MTKKKILIADDDCNIVISLNFLMAREGFDVLVAHDGEMALHSARNKEPDLILLDAAMPKIGGVEVCKALRADARTESLPVLMVTASPDDALKGMDVGANGYLTKPFSTHELVQRIRGLLEMPA